MTETMAGQVDAMTNATPLVSVVLSFHNAGSTLLRSLRSIQWQTYPHWELILLDDGSTDDGAECVDLLQDSRVRLYGDSRRRGLPARLNQGVGLARGKYIARMDADDIAFPERLERQVAYLECHPDVDLLATSVLLVDAQDQPVGVLGAGRSHEEICRKPWHGFPMPHPTWMGRADWFRQHPYDQRALKAQDQVLLYQTYRTSRFAGLPDVLLGYRYARLSVRKTLAGRYHYLRAVIAGGKGAHALAGTTTHAAAALRDLGGILFGMGSRVIRKRVVSIDASVGKDWDRLVAHLSSARHEKDA